MFKKLYPNEYVNSTYEIDYEGLYKKGFRGVLFDIDNTLVAHNADADERVMNLFARLRKIGYEVCIISNNKSARVTRFNEKIKANMIHNAKKPFRKNYRKAMSLMGTNTSNSLFVGDQVFTDVYGANRTGMYSILVKPINTKEEIQIILKRFPEKIVLHYFHKSKMK